MFKRYLAFVRGVSRSRLGKLGVVLTTSSVLTFLLLQVLSLLGVVRNAYAGLIIYLLFPALFVLGLGLIPLGWWRLRRASRKTKRELLEESFGPEQVTGGRLGAPIAQTVLVLTVLNVAILGLASMRALRFMDSPRFCGTACHSVMNPEWVTYQSSPHARVACTECHVGEGLDALVESKMRGAWQMISVTLDLLERPIPTPVHTLRPAQETCEHCHWPDKFYGTEIRTIVRYGMDEAATPRTTTLGLKIDAGSRGLESGIHWHIAEANEVRYASVNDERQEMIWVEVLQPDGSWRRFENRRLSAEPSTAERVRVIDCIDCHNRATHVYEDPEDALDRALRLGRIDSDLPYVKREALAALTGSYPTVPAAERGIANHLGAFYRREYPARAGAFAAGIDEAVAVLQRIYARNVHPEMNITWGTYPSHARHRRPDYGCFRCHNDDLQDAEGQTISDDCTLCHSILAFDAESRFEFLEPIPEGARDAPMRRYLREEFLRGEPD